MARSDGVLVVFFGKAFVFAKICAFCMDSPGGNLGFFLSIYFPPYYLLILNS